jgi:hypothetical protein
MAQGKFMQPEIAPVRLRRYSLLTVTADLLAVVLATAVAVRAVLAILVVAAKAVLAVAVVVGAAMLEP